MPATAVETDSDRAKLAMWVRESERLGAILDPAKLRFKCLEPDPFLRAEVRVLIARISTTTKSQGVSFH